MADLRPHVRRQAAKSQSQRPRSEIRNLEARKHQKTRVVVDQPQAAELLLPGPVDKAPNRPDWRRYNAERQFDPSTRGASGTLPTIATETTYTITYTVRDNNPSGWDAIVLGTASTRFTVVVVPPATPTPTAC